MKCYVRGEGGNTVSFPPEPLCVCPGSLTKQEAPAMGLAPGPLLSPERGQRGPAAPSTRLCLELPPSLSLEAGSASSSLVSGCPWLLCCPGREQPPCQLVPALLVDSTLGVIGGTRSASPGFSCERHVVSSFFGVSHPSRRGQRQFPPPWGPAGPGTVFSDMRAPCSPGSL